MTRFSTRPSAPTRMTSARPEPRATNSMCLIAPSDLGARTRPAAADRPDSIEEASDSIVSSERPRAASEGAMAACSSSVSWPNWSRPSTKRRRPFSVGRRPADVWGEKRRPASVRSAMTLRIVAGDSGSGSRRDRVRLPTGSPVSRYCSTISRKMAAERSSRPSAVRVSEVDGSMGEFTPNDVVLARCGQQSARGARSRFALWLRPGTGKG